MRSTCSPVVDKDIPTKKRKHSESPPPLEGGPSGGHASGSQAVDKDIPTTKPKCSEKSPPFLPPPPPIPFNPLPLPGGGPSGGCAGGSQAHQDPGPAPRSKSMPTKKAMPKSAFKALVGKGGDIPIEKHKCSEKSPPPLKKQDAAKKLKGTRSDFPNEFSFVAAMVQERRNDLPTLVLKEFELLSHVLDLCASRLARQISLKELQDMGRLLAPSVHWQDQVFMDPDKPLVTKPILVKPSNQN